MVAPGNPANLSVYVGPLQKGVSRDQIEIIFSQFGKIANVDIRGTHAILEFTRRVHMQRAIEKMNGRFYKGTTLMVKKAAIQQEKVPSVSRSPSRCSTPKLEEEPISRQVLNARRTYRRDISRVPSLAAARGREMEIRNEEDAPQKGELNENDGFQGDKSPSPRPRSASRSRSSSRSRHTSRSSRSRKTKSVDREKDARPNSRSPRQRKFRVPSAKLEENSKFRRRRPSEVRQLLGLKKRSRNRNRDRTRSRTRTRSRSRSSRSRTRSRSGSKNRSRGRDDSVEVEKMAMERMERLLAALIEENVDSNVEGQRAVKPESTSTALFPSVRTVTPTFETAVPSPATPNTTSLRPNTNLQPPGRATSDIPMSVSQAHNTLPEAILISSDSSDGLEFIGKKEPKRQTRRVPEQKVPIHNGVKSESSSLKTVSVKIEPQLVSVSPARVQFVDGNSRTPLVTCESNTITNSTSNILTSGTHENDPSSQRGRFIPSFLLNMKS